MIHFSNSWARLVLRSLYVQASVCVCVCVVCVCVCMCVGVCACVHSRLSVLRYIIPLLCHYSHERSGSYWVFVRDIGIGSN